MKKIAGLVLAMLAVLMMVSAAWAGNDTQLTEKQKNGIISAAKMHYSKERVSFYNTRVFIRDSVGWVVTFKVDGRRVADIQVRPGRENFGAFMFLMDVSTFIEHPEGFGGNATIGKIGGDAQ